MEDSPLLFLPTEGEVLENINGVLNGKLGKNLALGIYKMTIEAYTW